MLRARPGHVTSLVGKAAAAAALQDYATVGEAVETAQTYGLQVTFTCRYLSLGILTLSRGCRRARLSRVADFFPDSKRIDYERCLAFCNDK